MNVSVIIFPGSNCDQDIVSSIHSITKKKPNEIWYKNNIPKNSDLIVLPGGFSFGDYLRSGAIASASNIIREVISFSKSLGKIIVLTRGEKGAVAINGNEVVECGIKKGLKIVDLTGAGDLFASGFLHGHVNNMSLKDSLDKGTEMSSKVIQQIEARL